MGVKNEFFRLQTRSQSLAGVKDNDLVIIGRKLSSRPALEAAAWHHQTRALAAPPAFRVNRRLFSFDTMIC